MAEKAGSVSTNGEGVAIVVWQGMAAGDTGAPVSIAAWPFVSVQGVGTGTVALEGSNDGVTWAALNDESGTPIAVTAGAIAKVAAPTLFIRPSVTTNAANAFVVGTGRR